MRYCMTFWQICHCRRSSELLLVVLLACIKLCEDLKLRMCFWTTRYNRVENAYKRTVISAWWKRLTRQIRSLSIRLAKGTAKDDHDRHSHSVLAALRMLLFRDRRQSVNCWWNIESVSLEQPGAHASDLRVNMWIYSTVADGGEAQLRQRVWKFSRAAVHSSAADADEARCGQHVCPVDDHQEFTVKYNRKGCGWQTAVRVSVVDG